MKTDSRIAHRSAEANAGWLAFWIQFGMAIRVADIDRKMCDACQGTGNIWVGMRGWPKEQSRCYRCKGAGKR